MKHIFDNNLNLIHNDTALTIGNFDGLHTGHRKLISVVKECSQKYKLDSAVLSFTPHPMSTLTDDSHFQTITSPEEKSFLLQDIGIDFYIEYPFDKDFSMIGPECFVEEILFKQLRCKVIVVGKGYRFGKNRKGSYEMLCELGKKNGVSVIGCDHVEENGKKVSSSKIRKLISQKEFGQIEKYLTRPYFIMGKVLHGKKLGRTIGFPTVNLTPYKNKVLPPCGIYFTKTKFDGTEYYSVTNIGDNPTVNGETTVIETYIFGFDGDLYGKTVWIDFYKFLRDEIKFQSVEQLKERITMDITLAKDYYGIQ